MLLRKKINTAKKQQLVPSDRMLTRHHPKYKVEDFVVEILSRLPVKSLNRFRCICKSWCDLISDSFFVMKHANQAKKATSSLKLLVSIEPFQSIDCEALLKHEDEDGHVESSQPKLDLSKCCPDMLRSCHLYIVGSCNGLICLHGVDCYRDYSDILLWNPCTGDTKVLPEHTFFRAHYDGKYRHPMFYGFGYDSGTDDYQVILGDGYVRQGDDFCYQCIKVAVFTLKIGSWRNYYEERRVNDIGETGCIRLGGQGCLSNGALHWIELDGWRSRIISFDLAREKFQEILSLSSFVDREFFDHIPSSETFVGIESTIENSLLVYIYVPSHTSETMLTIWVMNEYGAKASWSELVHISLKIDLSRPGFGIHDSLFPVRILENGEVLMSCNEHELVLYNPKEKTYKTVLVTNLSCEGVMYAETLVSPVIDGGVTSSQRCGEAKTSKTTLIDCFGTSCLSFNKWIMGIPKKPWKLRMEP